MPRHSKNASHRSYHTFAERSKGSALNQWGTQRARLGRDSQLPFGHCSLTLTATDDPVASPSGHVYDRQAIYSYMLEKIHDAKLIGVEEPELVQIDDKKHAAATSASPSRVDADGGGGGGTSSSTAVVPNVDTNTARRRDRDEAEVDNNNDETAAVVRNTKHGTCVCCICTSLQLYITLAIQALVRTNCVTINNVDLI
jgi:hypothetical protein